MRFSIDPFSSGLLNSAPSVTRVPLAAITIDQSVLHQFGKGLTNRYPADVILDAEFRFGRQALAPLQLVREDSGLQDVFELVVERESGLDPIPC